MKTGYSNLLGEIIEAPQCIKWHDDIINRYNSWMLRLNVLLLELDVAVNRLHDYAYYKKEHKYYNPFM